MTVYILIVTVLISLWAFNSGQVMHALIFNAYQVEKKNQWYRLISSGFIHADWMHLLINMYVFYTFGSHVERVYSNLFHESGLVYFLLLYFGGIIISIIPTYLRQRHRPGYNSLGASGGVSSIVFAFILFYPFAQINLFLFVPLPAILMGLGYLAYSYYMDKKGGDNINHNAHFWGALYGVVLTIVLKPELVLNFIDRIRN